MSWCCNGSYRSIVSPTDFVSCLSLHVRHTLHLSLGCCLAGGGFGAVSVNKVSPAVIKFSGVPRRTSDMSPSVLADNLNTVFSGDAHKASMNRKSLEYSASQPSFDTSSSAAGSSTPDRHASFSLRGSAKRTPNMSSTPMADNVGALWNNSPLTGGDKSSRCVARQ